MKPHYIYIPGLGTAINGLRRLGLLTWRLRGRSVSMVPMNWDDADEPYQDKLRRVVDEIKVHSDRPIILVGESAGGPIAVQALLAESERVSSVRTYCGYNSGAQHIHDIQRQTHPAFVEIVRRNDADMAAIQAEADRITTVYSTLDRMVAPERSRIIGARVLRMRVPIHQLAIAYAILTCK